METTSQPRHRGLPKWQSAGKPKLPHPTTNSHPCNQGLFHPSGVGAESESPNRSSDLYRWPWINFEVVVRVEGRDRSCFVRALTREDAISDALGMVEADGYELNSSVLIVSVEESA